jgi:transposase
MRVPERPLCMRVSRKGGQGGAAAGTTTAMQTEPTEPTSKRRNFDEAFKRDAVALLCKGDQPIKQLAQELGVSHWNLRDWKKRYGPPAPIRSSEVVETELRALRRENERLRAQCDILKKTLGILVEPSPNASRA